MSDRYDYVVIGGGSAGVRSARIAASLGAKVAIIEGSRWGGTCVNLGCIPKKLFSYGAAFHESFKDAEPYGWHLEQPGFHWPRLVANKDKEIARLNRVYEQLLAKSGVTLIHAHAKLMSPNQVALTPVTSAAETNKVPEYIDAGAILIATGSRPFVPDVEGASHGKVSDDLFYLPSLPKRMVINGSGYIAVEFASIFAGLGVEVDLVYRSGDLLRRFDKALGCALGEALQRAHVNLWPSHKIASIKPVGEGAYRVALSKSDVGASSEVEQVLETNLVCFATGRVPNTEALGVDDLGIRTATNGAIEIDEHFQTSVPGIYGVGDVIDRVTLTPVAIREGTWVAKHLFASDKTQPPLNYDLIPSAVFSHPPVAVCGLSEVEAKQRGFEVEIFQSQFKPLKNTISNNQQKTLMKMVVDAPTQVVLGMHMLGEDAPEMMQGFAVALKMGAKKTDFDATVGIHPSSAEEWVTLK